MRSAAIKPSWHFVHEKHLQRSRLKTSPCSLLVPLVPRQILAAMCHAWWRVGTGVCWVHWVCWVLWVQAGRRMAAGRERTAVIA